jgi:hypothetical protein
MLPEVDSLPDVARVYAMARVGRGIVGSEKMTGFRTRQSLNQKCLVCTLPAAASTGVARTDYHHITRDWKQN